MKKLLKLPIHIFLVLALTFCITACESNAIEVSEENSDIEGFIDGSYVNDIDISGKTLEEALLLVDEYVSDLQKNSQVEVLINENVEIIKGTDVDFTYDILEELAEMFNSQTATEIYFDYEVDEDAVLDIILSYADKYNCDVADATMDGFDFDNETFIFTEEVYGLEIDVESTSDLILYALENGISTEIEIIKEDFSPQILMADLEKEYVMLSTYQTTTTNTENGNHNMGLAFEYINGTVLEVGEMFSFNAIVGKRTTEAGFLAANGISSGTYVSMVGGGICQAASTIYIAALYSGLTINERDWHDIPSSYVPIGLDATISYGSIDLKFTNNTEDAIYLVTTMEDKVLTATFYGKQTDEWDYTEIECFIDEVIEQPEETVYKEVSSMEEGEYKRVTTGYKGYETSGQIVYYKDGEVVKTEAIESSVYNAKAETYYIGPNTDITKITGSSGYALFDPEPEEEEESSEEIEEESSEVSSDEELEENDDELSSIIVEN